MLFQLRCSPVDGLACAPPNGYHPGGTGRTCRALPLDMSMAYQRLLFDVGTTRRSLRKRSSRNLSRRQRSLTLKGQWLFVAGASRNLVVT